MTNLRMSLVVTSRGWHVLTMEAAIDTGSSMCDRSWQTKEDDGIRRDHDGIQNSAGS